MQLLMRLRPSNLIILAALPFIVYLFATSSAYQRSLRALIGIENGSSAYIPGFMLLALAFATGLGVVAFSRQTASRPLLAGASAAINLLAVATTATTAFTYPYLASVVANMVDPFTSTLVVQGETPRRLTGAAAAMVESYAKAIFWVYLILTTISLAFLALTVGRTAKVARAALLTMNCIGILFIVFIAPMTWAAGLATTIRAAIAAYILAALLGLVWLGLLKLDYSRRTNLVFTAMTVLLTCAAAWFLLQPRNDYALVGDLSGKVAIVSGTPTGLIDAVRYGQFPGAPEDEVPLRTLKEPDGAVAALKEKAGVSAALLPAAAAPADLPVLWRSSVLNNRDKTSGITLAVLAIVVGLLTFGGHIHRRHPLSIGSEFMVDTIRGIPMLVIVLYVGLPLAGALKDSTQGVFDPPNLARGIAAMALAYSAYLAEIFRSGINAIPRGQLEAARSLGLNGWQTARLVILPQAFRIVIPPLGNELIAILKDTSLLSILSIRDITQRMREFQSASFLPFAPYNSAAIFYILLTLAAASLISTVERKYDITRR